MLHKAVFIVYFLLIY